MASSTLVSDIHGHTEQLNGEQVDHVADTYFFIDGVKVTEKVYNLCEALRNDRAFQGCKFGTTSDGNYSPNSEIYVYFSDEIYCRGVIGYRDVGVKETIYKYFVETESIVNYKVKTNKRQRNMLSSKAIPKIIKVAKQHLRKLSLERIVGLTAWKLTAALGEEKDCKSEAEEEAMKGLSNQLTRNGTLTAELVNMVKINYEFADNSVRESIVAYMGTIDNEIEVSSRVISIALVLIHPPHSEGAEHEITVQRGEKHLNLSKRVFTSDVTATLKDAKPEVYTPATLPDDITQKISTLNICEGNVYIDGVGCRQSENIYYIAEDV